MSTTTEAIQTKRGQEPSTFHRGRLAFRHWRWRRPFWAGLFTVFAGLPIAYFPYANMTFGELTIRMATTAGAGSLVIGVLLVVLGLTMWFQPQSRIFAGVAAILLALVSLVVSNFGGFLVGFLFGLVGGGMSVAWVPGEPEADAGAPEPTRAAPPARAPDGGPALAGTGSALADFDGDVPERGLKPGN